MNIGGTLRRRADLLAYVPLAVTTTAAAVTGRPRAHLVSKMLLAPTLAGGVVATRADRSTTRTATLAMALVGSAVGDWFMNRSDVAPHHSDARRQLMRAGASAFAVQQAGLLRLLLTDGVRPRAKSAAAAGSVMAGLATLELSATGEPDPVLTGYGLLLGSMSALSLSDGGSPRRRRSVALGGGLFLVSDAAIIVGEHLAKTPRHRAMVSGIVLSTYTAALALLVHGLRDAPRNRKSGAA
ncbi:lysoplasmalogenase family protein [Knoellia sp. CPCC 206453]|uniref:lysoplasmalogenase family protein n=1 Tax=Knoellia pratensis TaxID=3404796 RepID=UPI00361B5233